MSLKSRLTETAQYSFDNMSDEKSICEYLNKHIKGLYSSDGGAFQVRKEKIGNVVDIEWSDGVSGFVLKDVLNFINKHGSITKSELMEFTC